MQTVKEVKEELYCVCYLNLHNEKNGLSQLKTNKPLAGASGRSEREIS